MKNTNNKKLNYYFYNHGNFDLDEHITVLIRTKKYYEFMKFYFENGNENNEYFPQYAYDEDDNKVDITIRENFVKITDIDSEIG